MYARAQVAPSPAHLFAAPSDATFYVAMNNESQTQLAANKTTVNETVVMQNATAAAEVAAAAELARSARGSIKATLAQSAALQPPPAVGAAP